MNGAFGQADGWPEKPKGSSAEAAYRAEAGQCWKRAAEEYAKAAVAASDSYQLADEPKTSNSKLGG